MGTMKAVAIISGDNNVRGSLQFLQDPNGTTHVKGKITGLTPGLHGFHIHALGDTTNGCNSTGPHFNPLKKNHGAPSDGERHAGDLGNIIAGTDGVAEVSVRDIQIPLSGQHSILGRAVVVHADPDDLGRGDINNRTVYDYGSCFIMPYYCGFSPYLDSLMKGIVRQGYVLDDGCGHELSKTTGNAGARVGCGIIGLQSSV